VVKKFKKIAAIFIIILLVFSVSPGMGAPDTPINKVTTDPDLNKGKKWRIGFCESEPYMDYASSIYYLARGLDELGWISGTEALPYVEGQDDTAKMWQWLSSHNSKYIEFVPDAYYSLKSMADIPGQNKEDTILNRLRDTKDIDLMIVTGTKAGLALANDRHNVPVLVFSASDPVGAGIVKSDTDSGNDHVWAHIDRNQYRRQVQVFHDIFGFKKLGIVYENTEVARNYCAIGDVEDVAREKGFQLVRKFVYEPVTDQDFDRYYREVMEANRELASKVDAALVIATVIPAEKIPPLIQPFTDKKIPTFSQAGAPEVKAGVLMSITSNDYPNLKLFGAETIIKVLKGVPPRGLSQVFESTPRIILNFDTAKKIGYKPPFDILLVADEIFKTSK
jgi:ABC-type uncharacterized transport system substrate-binding protein